MPHGKRPVVIIDGKVLGSNSFARGGFQPAPVPRRPESHDVILNRCLRLMEAGKIDAAEELFERAASAR